MRVAERRLFPNQGDGLRLLALGRIQRCRRCPRYRVLSETRGRKTPPSSALPGVPAFCSYQVCAPLVARYDGMLHRSRPGAVGALRVAGS
jgi:hypothetical protein